MFPQWITLAWLKAGMTNKRFTTTNDEFASDELQDLIDNSDLLMFNGLSSIH